MTANYLVLIHSSIAIEVEAISYVTQGMCHQ